MLPLWIIQPSSSPWCSSPVAVLKKDKAWRICIDFRELNKVTKRNTYPMPTVDAMLDLSGESKVGGIQESNQCSGFMARSGDAKRESVLSL